MITTLKSIVSCEVWVWGIVSKEIFLGVHSLNNIWKVYKDLNMCQVFAKVYQLAQKLRGGTIIM